ncbi:MAG TPA: phage virion morphogenesis protein [Pyrinomonadaceae bacterium]|nr:phage virion morphogenesis protein [Pyrinomonadaceae bacterium]
MANDIQGIENLFRRVRKLATDSRQVQKPLKAAGVVMLSSIQQNFKAQGRPQKWQKLSAATIAGRRKGKGKGKAQILIDKGRLKNSHSMKVSSGGVEVGTNVIYAKRQHYGFPGGKGKGKSKTPARPFVMFQDEDFDTIGQIFNRHIAGR